LIPVIEERLKEQSGNKEAQAKALLKLKVCDAAAGSGHMLLAAARTIAWYLARVQSGEENPAPSVYRSCLREVIQHCIYAVDFNPDAVELCKLALWLEGHNSGKPLSFLDHKIRNGNSLVGVSDLSVLQRGIPDDAFNPVTGDDKKVCQELKKENAKYNKTKQGTFDFDQSGKIDTTAITGDYKELENIRQDDLEGVKQVKKKFDTLRSNHAWFNDWRACNLWTAAFFWNYNEENKQAAPNSERLAKFLLNPAAAYGPMIGKADALSVENKFFHWPLEFPDVFEQGGFDVMLGNPPWEMIQADPQEFFVGKNHEIVKAESQAKRKKLVEKLVDSNIDQFNEYQKFQHSTESIQRFVHHSEIYSLSNIGRLNTYSIFLELSTRIINKKGHLGFIIPTGIATDSFNQAFFKNLIDTKTLKSLIDYENRGHFFPDVDSSFKFCAITLSGKRLENISPKFSFFNKRVEELNLPGKVYEMSWEDFELFNPNTKTCPVFRNAKDYVISKKIYKNHDVLVNHQTNDEKYRFQLMFMMNTDSVHFIKKSELVTLSEKEKYLALYEGKMIFNYNHRYQSVTFNENNSKRPGQPLDVSLSELEDPHFTTQPLNYIKEEVVINRIKDKGKCNWFLGLRNISSPNNEKFITAAIIPYSGVGNSITVIHNRDGAKESALLLASLNSVVVEYLIRQKIAGPNINVFYIEQLPIRVIIPPHYYHVILNYVLELTYTSWDIKAFADDVWKEADADLRAAILQQWEANKAITGGHEWAPPEWCEIGTEGCSLLRWSS